MSHIVTLSVVTRHDKGWADAFDTLSKVALASGDQFANVTVSSIDMEDELEITADLEEVEEFHDENTMKKVYDTLRAVTIVDAREFQLSEDAATDIITALQNAGILFREIKK